MTQTRHSTIGEGLLAGLIGGLVVAAWFLVVDLGRGQALHTPNILGQVFVQADTTPGVRTIAADAVIQYFLLHFGIFVLFGIALSALAHLATRNPSFRMGVWFFLVIHFLLFLGVVYALHLTTNERFPWWTFLIASLLGVGATGYYIWRRHPALRGSVRDLPLGAEVESPPHPPGRATKIGE